MKSISLGMTVVLLLSIVSLFIGAADITKSDNAWQLMTLSRLPRTLAIILAGMSLAIAGVIMQMLAQNKFVEPTTTGTVEWATLGILLTLIFWPQSPVYVKLIIACLFSVIGAASFLFLLTKIKIRSDVIVPLTGIMYAGVMSAIITFIAYRYDLIQSLWAWVQGDFSMVLKGRYEMLWIGAGISALAYVTADQFTVAGLGKSMASNLGINFRVVYLWGIIVVALIAGITVVNAGTLPFLGLIVPNIVSMVMGDNLRKSLPWIALTGASLVLVCDILARVINHPYEIPVGTIMGIVGSVIFLMIIFRRARYA